MMIWFIFIFSFLLLVGFMVTQWLIDYSHKNNILDKANYRSSHTIATPRIGGLGFVAIISFGLLMLGIFIEQKSRTALVLGMLIPCLLVACAGLLDDLKGISQRLRFFMYLCGSLLAVLQLHFIAGAEWFYVLLATVAFAWLINLFNFMDGIDGIAASEAVFILIALSYFSYSHDNQMLAFGLACCAAPILGFILLNWQPAKIFMGDVGSTFLGCLLGGVVVVTINLNIISAYSTLILLGSFVVDASWTLSYRLITGQKWYSAHRSHLYQILSRHFKSHQKVTLLYSSINLCWLMPLSVFAYEYKNYALAIAILAFLPLFGVCFMVGAGKSNQN